MKKIKMYVFLVIILLFVSLLCGCQEKSAPLDNETVEETETATRETIPESEIIVIPKPEHFFGVDELIFEEFPEAALKAYYDLMIEKYGFSMKYSDIELTKINYLSYGETDNYDIWIVPSRNEDGLICINFMIPNYCREEPLETWEGDIDSYLYNPDHWVECSSCEGTGDCSRCNGRGWTTFGQRGSLKRRCDNCNGSGDCHDCWDGYIKIEQDDWSQLSDEEKIERDWKRYAEELINRNK